MSFDPFEEYVIVPEGTRQKWAFSLVSSGYVSNLDPISLLVPRYVSRRQELLTEGVNPADLSVYGAALTQDLSPSKRVTNADVAVCFPCRATRIER